MARVAVVMAGILFYSTEIRADGQPNSWHNMTQTQRANAIINTGHLYVNQYGGQCKMWIQLTVVPQASGYHVYLPVNAPNGWSWQSDTTGNTTLMAQGTQMSYAIEYAQPGQIVQMLFKGKNGQPPVPHTAIVVGVNASLGGIYFMDSNWNLDEIVRTHFLTFASFYSKLYAPGYYSIYQVN